LQPPYVPGGQGINPPALTQPNTNQGQIPGTVEENKSQQPQPKEEKKVEKKDEKLPKNRR
jgi:hypothetical protein